jgi:hypothetical protein
MGRLLPAVSQAYYDFWARLVPLSNQQTGFSLRSPTRRSVIQVTRLGFCFRYHLAYDAPDATVAFVVQRSDADQIYRSLVRQRARIEAAFGGSLLWLRESPDPTEQAQGTSPAVLVTLPSPPLRDLDRSAWPTLQARMVDAMVRLERAVVPSLAKWLSEDD